MKIEVGYIGVVTVTAEKDTWDDQATVLGEDPAHEEPGFEFCKPTLLAAWKAAQAVLIKRGGVVTHAAPADSDKFIVVGEATDIIPCAQGGDTSFDDAVVQLTKKMYDLENELCKDWAKTHGHLSVTFTDKDGYKIKLSIRSASSYRDEMNKLYPNPTDY